MPKVGRLDVLTKLREIELYRQTEIIIYTMLSIQQDKVKYFNVEANGFIIKHYDFESLGNALNEMFFV